LDLTEGRATGISTIQKALKDNGSAAATIETDDDRTYFLITIPCRSGFEGGISDAANKAGDILGYELERKLGQISV